MVVYAVCSGRWRMAALAGASASAIFVAWEAFTALRYGQSHFLHAVLASASAPAADDAILGWPLSLLSILGATAPAFGLLGLVALRAPRWLLLAGFGLASLCFAGLPLLPRSPVPGLDSLATLEAPSGELLAFVGIGLAVVAIVTLCAVELGRLGGRASGAPAGGRGAGPASVCAFLLVWLGLEIAAYFALSPFPATRRVLGLTVVLALSIGHLASRRLAGEAARRPVYEVAAWGVLLGLLYTVTEHQRRDGTTRSRAARLGPTRVARLRSRSSEGLVRRPLGVPVPRGGERHDRRGAWRLPAGGRRLAREAARCRCAGDRLAPGRARRSERRRRAQRLAVVHDSERIHRSHAHSGAAEGPDPGRDPPGHPKRSSRFLRSTRFENAEPSTTADANGRGPRTRGVACGRPRSRFDAPLP